MIRKETVVRIELRQTLVEGLVRFEGLYFLPPSGRVVHDLGLVAAGRTASARVRIRAGSYLVVAMEGSVVAAASTLRAS